MKGTISLTKLVGQPPTNIRTDFLTPVRLAGADDWWSARVYWGRFDSKKCGDEVELELIAPTAPRFDAGDSIEIFGVPSFEAFGEAIHTFVD